MPPSLPATGPSPGIEVAVRPITDLPALRQVEALQQAVWGMAPLDVVPAHQLLAATAAGGVVLGAFAPDGTLVGFCYGFVGMRDGHPFFYSHMAGVVDAYRGRAVGLALKRAQRGAALARGLDRMVWTFDPLQSANAHFNFRKLGVTARRYYVDYYGEMADALNRGLPSDRLEVDWELRSPEVVARLEGEGEQADARRAEGRWDAAAQEAPAALEATTGGPWPRPGDPLTDLDAPAVRLAIPADLGRLRREDPALALAWREATRTAFLAYFARGYAAVDFLRGPTVGHYLLRTVR